MKQQHKRLVLFVLSALLITVFALQRASHVYAEDSTRSGFERERQERREMLEASREAKIAERENDREEKQKALELAKETKSSERTQNLKERANQEIDRRVKSLTELKTKVANLKKLTAEQKTNFSNQIQKEIDSLTTLKTTIANETDFEKLKTEVKSIVQSYRVYAFFMPQMQILIANESLLETASLLTTWADKLEARIAEAKTAGKDVIAMTAQLTDMRSQIKSATDNLNSVETTIASLTVDGFPANKTTLQMARSTVEKARKSLNIARQDGQKIRVALGEVKELRKEMKATQSSGLR